MKYQDFSSDENFVSSEDTIFIFQMPKDITVVKAMKFTKVICLIAVIFRIHINATYFLYFLTKIRMCVRSIFYYIDSANKGLVQEIVILLFHRSLHNKQKITWPLGDKAFIFSC